MKAKNRRATSNRVQRTKTKTTLGFQTIATNAGIRGSALTEKEIALRVIDALTVGRKPQTILDLAEKTGIDYRKHDLSSVIWRLADAGILRVTKNLMVSQHRRSRLLATREL